MEYSEIFRKVKESLNSYYKKNRGYATLLASNIHLGTRSVNRKLKGETEFSLDEILKIAKLVNKPPEYFLESDKGKQRYRMEIITHDFNLPYEKQHGLKWGLNLWESITNKNLKLYIASNSIPSTVTPFFDYIARFIHLKWLYSNFGHSSVIPLEKVSLPGEIKNARRRYNQSVRSTSRAVYVVSVNVFKNYLEEIRYFHSRGLLNLSDVVKLLGELEVLLKVVSNITKTWAPGKSGEIELLCCEMPIAQEITIIESDMINMGILHTQEVNYIPSDNAATVALIKSWFYGYLRSSSLVSYCAEDNRTYFLDKQAKAIQSYKLEAGI